ncbi:MAG TPA: glycosyltransferase family 4 protein, partial [Chthoniobacterales bacterium]
WINRFFGIQFSLTAHANDIFAPKDFAVSLAMLFESAAAIVTVSDFAVRQLQERFPENTAKVHRVYNGVDLSRFLPSDFSASPPAIIAIGRLIEKKGFDDLIAACESLRSRGRDFVCRIIGEGPLEGSLRAQIASAGLENFVQLAGPRTEAQIAPHLAGATVFALPCTKDADGGMDNLPTVIMEAMAAGLPVISTPLAGVPEMVQPGVTGELVPEQDPVALADALEALMAEPDRARRLGMRGREVAREKFSIEQSAGQLRQLFGEL